MPDMAHWIWRPACHRAPLKCSWKAAGVIFGNAAALKSPVVMTAALVLSRCINCPVVSERYRRSGDIRVVARAIIPLMHTGAR